jgi:hypothetical protein
VPAPDRPGDRQAMRERARATSTIAAIASILFITSRPGPQRSGEASSRIFLLQRGIPAGRALTAMPAPREICCSAASENAGFPPPCAGASRSKCTMSR